MTMNLIDRGRTPQLNSPTQASGAFHQPKMSLQWPVHANTPNNLTANWHQQLAGGAYSQNKVSKGSGKQPMTVKNKTFAGFDYQIMNMDAS
jgi:hypothetical protein